MSRALLALGSVAALSGCLAVTPPGAHMTDPVSADDLCTRLAQIACDGYDRCCDDPARPMPFDRARCVSDYQTSCTSGMPSISQAVHDARTGYDAAYAGAMLGTYRDFVDRCDPSIVAWSGRRDGLLAALRGTVDNGVPCLRNESLSMNYPAFLSCRDSRQSCIVSRIDLAGNGDGLCQERRPEGGDCILDFDCQDGLYCAPRPLNYGICARQLGTGGSCMSDSIAHGHWCQSSFCYMGHCEEPQRTHVYCGGGVI